MYFTVKKISLSHLTFNLIYIVSFFCKNTDAQSVLDFSQIETQSSLNFFGDLLNTTTNSISDLEDIVKDFVFIQKVNPNNLFLLYFPPDKEPTEYVVLSSKNVTKFLTKQKIDNLHIMIPGWATPGNADWVLEMASNFSMKSQSSGKPYHVVSLDWYKYAKTNNYLYASQYVHAVGNFLGEFLVTLHQEKNGVKVFGNLHLIGHSLGAHIAGVAGGYVKSKLGTTVPWITGLDPAGPLFTVLLHQPPSHRLVATSAKFVDMLHTSIYLEGQSGADGTVDFFINKGGPIQPVCYADKNAASCSHNMAPFYYSYTINNPELYMAVKCDNRFYWDIGLCKDSKSKIPMGFEVPKSASGIYYVTANATNA